MGNAMHRRASLASVVLMAALSAGCAVARAQDLPGYPDWSGQWLRIGGIQWDPAKPLGLAQQPPPDLRYFKKPAR